jgi:hypothetical protein
VLPYLSYYVRLTESVTIWSHLAGNSVGPGIGSGDRDLSD